MKKEPKIYALVDPRTLRIRYIGRTCTTLTVRLNGHIQTAMRGKKVDKTKENWIRELKAEGLRPAISLIQESTLETLCADEVRVLAQYRDTHPDLLNIRKGGGGGTIDGGRGIKWSEKHLGMLGAIADTRLAKLMGISQKTVLAKRHSLGIAATVDKTTYPRARTPLIGRKIHMPPEVIAKMGTMPDTHLAKMYGIDHVILHKRRVELGIKKYEGPVNRTYKRKISLDDPRLSIIGTQTDKEAGKALGVSHTAIRHARLALGIPPYGKRTPRGPEFAS
jgi:hypothetical protein